jgi:hypothetical protein
MKKFIYLLFFSLLVSISYAQSVRLGSVNMRDVVVVTNEQDTIALSELQHKINSTNGFADHLIVTNGLIVDNILCSKYGFEAGLNSSGNDYITIGNYSGTNASLSHTISIGDGSSVLGNLENSVLIGIYAGGASKFSHLNAIGYHAGAFSTGQYATAVGHSAAREAKGTRWSAFGQQAGQNSYGDYWTAVGITSGRNSSGNSWTSVGGWAGRNVVGDFWNAFGYYSGYYARGTNNIYFGNYAGRNASENDAIFIDNLSSDPGITYNPTNSLLYLKGGNIKTAHIGRPDGKVNLRGSVNIAENITLNNKTIKNFDEIIPEFLVKESKSNSEQLSTLVSNIPFNNSHILYGDITQPSGTSFLFTEEGPDLNDIWYRQNIVKNSGNAETNSVTYKWSIPTVGSYNFKISSTFGAKYTNEMYLTATIKVFDSNNNLIAQSLSNVSYPHARGTLVPSDQYFYELGKFTGSLSAFLNGPGTLEYTVTMGGMESTENYVLFSSPKDTFSAMTLEWSTNALPALVGSDPGPNQVQKLWKGTQEEYDNVPVKSPSTAYLVENNGGPIYRDLEEYNAVPAPYTTTVHLVSSRTTYQVNVDTNMFLSFDASNLDLSGRECEFKLRLNITETNIPAMQFVGMAFDVEPEILVTGIWEFAVSTVDGIKYRAKQTWPEPDEWATASYAYASSGWVASLQRMDVNNTSTNSLMVVCPPAPLLLIRPGMTINCNKPTSFSYGFSTHLMPQTSVPTVLYGPFSVSHGYSVEATHAVENPSRVGLVQIWVGNSSPDSIASVFVYPGGTSIRPANANERAAYEAGWRP